MPKRIRLLTAMAAACLLGGCSDYLDSYESVTPYSGEAIAANRVAQMVDPWPASSANRNFPTSGERMQRAMDRYKSGASSAPISATASDSSVAGSGSGSGGGSGSGSGTGGGSTTTGISAGTQP